MLSCSIIRAAGIYYQGTLDFPWQVFWLHSEACIGVIMGSITVYRSTIVGTNEVSDKLLEFWHKLLNLLTHSYTPGSDSGETKDPQKSDHLLLRIPRATLTGLRTVFGVVSHTSPIKNTAATQDSEIGLVEVEYHAYIKAQASHIQRWPKWCVNRVQYN
jgi:hypothetical protein